MAQVFSRCLGSRTRDAAAGLSSLTIHLSRRRKAEQRSKAEVFRTCINSGAHPHRSHAEHQPEGVTKHQHPCIPRLAFLHPSAHHVRCNDAAAMSPSSQTQGNLLDVCSARTSSLNLSHGPLTKRSLRKICHILAPPAFNPTEDSDGGGIHLCSDRGMTRLACIQSREKVAVTSLPAQDQQATRTPQLGEH